VGGFCFTYSGDADTALGNKRKKLQGLKMHDLKIAVQISGIENAVKKKKKENMTRVKDSLNVV